MKFKKNSVYYAVPLFLLIGLPAIPSVMLYKSSRAKPIQVSPNVANEEEYYNYTQTLDQVSVVTVDEFNKTSGVPLDSSFQNRASSLAAGIKDSKMQSTASEKVSSLSSIPNVTAHDSFRTDGIVIERMANGSMKATLPGSFFPEMKAKITEDGLVQVYCSGAAEDLTK